MIIAIVGGRQAAPNRIDLYFAYIPQAKRNVKYVIFRNEQFVYIIY